MLSAPKALGWCAATLALSVAHGNGLLLRFLAFVHTFSFTYSTGFCGPLHWQIPSRLSCHVVWGVNGESYYCPSANEKLQSTHGHGCHFLSCLPYQMCCRDGMPDTACPFPTRSHPARKGTNNGLAKLCMVISSKCNHFISNSFKFCACLWDQLYAFNIKMISDHSLWWHVISLRHHVDIVENGTISQSKSMALLL